MRQAWELAVCWRGELIRAELLHGSVRLAAGGPTTGDVPLPLDARALLLRGDDEGLELLAVGGAAWSIDGAGAHSGPVMFAQGTARLQLGDLEVAVQPTRRVAKLPRFGPIAPSLLRATVFAAAYGMLGLGLYTQPVEPRLGPQWMPNARVVQANPAAPSPPQAVAKRAPRWLAEDAVQPSAPPRLEARRPTIPPRRSGRRPAAPPADELSAARRFHAQLAELAAASLGDELVRLEDLERPPPGPSSDVGDEVGGKSGDSAGGGGTEPRGDPPGGRRGGAVGSCSGTLFATLVARHGEQTAIVACSTGVELGSQSPTRRRRHEVVVQERAGSPLAPEVWSWSARRH